LKSIIKMRTINYFAPITLERSIVIDAKVEEVWKVLVQIDNWSHWNKDISISKIDGRKRSDCYFRLKSGFTFRAKVHTLKDNFEFGWTGRALGLFLVNNCKLRKTEDKTSIYIEESLEGIFALLFRGMLQRNFDKRVDNWLQQIKIYCENTEN